MRVQPRLLLVVVVLAAVLVIAAVRREHSKPACGAVAAGWSAIDHVADGDTVVLCGGSTVRLVQIDTPEVYFGEECFGHQASAATTRLLSPGTAVRLVADPELDDVDGFGRLLRYVVRQDGLDVNIELVRQGLAAPYFFHGGRGMYADELLRLAEHARSEEKDLWGGCPGTRLDVSAGVDTGPASG